MSGGGDRPLACDNMTGQPHCARPVTMVDRAGYVYCAVCGLTRRGYEPCRTLRPWELTKLRRGGVIRRY